MTFMNDAVERTTDTMSEAPPSGPLKSPSAARTPRAAHLALRASAARSVVLALVIFSPSSLSAADLVFTPGADHVFTFDTGALTGHLAVQEKAQGILSLVDTASGKELTARSNEVGLFTLYRLFSTNHRWGTMAREWPKQARIRPDGSLEIAWPAEGDHPIKMAAAYRWSAVNALDLEITVTPEKSAPMFELFLSSYFNRDVRVKAYLKPTMHAAGQPELVAVEVNPLVVGTYISFPRDFAAARIVQDGRWEKGLHPAHWSTVRHMAAPLVLLADQKSGVSIVLMARPQDCFALGMSYNMEPPDGVAGHHSVYFSLFGKDLKPGESATARLRAVVGQGLTPEQALAAYQEFVKRE